MVLVKLVWIHVQDLGVGEEHGNDVSRELVRVVSHQAVVGQLTEKIGVCSLLPALSHIFDRGEKISRFCEQVIWRIHKLAHLDHFNVRLVEELVIGLDLYLSAHVAMDYQQILGRPEAVPQILRVRVPEAIPLFLRMANDNLLRCQHPVAIVIKKEHIARIETLFDRLIGTVPPIYAVVHVAGPRGVLARVHEVLVHRLLSPLLAVVV